MIYKLTEYSHGSGCGCKLSPGVLKEVLNTPNTTVFKSLIVGNETKDDAAVIDLDGETAIVSTTDFFMPIVDDPFNFGAIAATNAISDIYAMGAEPIMAIAILGWPIDKLPAKVASEVLNGGREVCHSAGIPLAGGHSIDAPEPIFGLAVTGKVPINRIKKNKDGKDGDILYLTKPLGIGMVTTAQKKKIASESDMQLAIKSMTTLNKIGKDLSKLDYVHALTDVTGFGLAGHLLEICEGANLSAILYEEKIPLFDFVPKYLEMDCSPGGAKRNWDTYGSKVKLKNTDFNMILSDPQTSGGLLISINPNFQNDFEKFMSANNLKLEPIGKLLQKNSSTAIEVL